MSSGEYPEELVELVTRALWARANGRRLRADEPSPGRGTMFWFQARAILDALSSAGRLVPEGSEVREEWGVRWPVVRTPNWPLETWDYGTRKSAETYATAYPQPDGVVLHRRVITTPPTPWTPAEPAQRTGEEGNHGYELSAPGIRRSTS